MLLLLAKVKNERRNIKEYRDKKIIQKNYKIIALATTLPNPRDTPPPPPKKRKKKPSLKMIGCCVKDSKKPDGWCITVTGWPIVWTIGYWKHLSNKENVLHVLKTYLLSSNNASSHQTKPVLEQNNCAFWVKIQLAMFAKY